MNLVTVTRLIPPNCRYAILAACLLSSCATTPENLQGVPQGLTEANRQQFAKNDLDSVLGVARDLQNRYEVARNDNLKYAFWSNVAFVPLAAVAAGAIAFNAYKDLFAGVGIAAGSLAGFNSFVNARNNAKVYQTGINGLDCVILKLGPYSSSSVSDITNGANDLERKLFTGKEDLINAQKFKFNTKPEIDEIKKNPLVITTLAASEKVLAQTIDDAEKALGDARTEVLLFNLLPSFATDGISQVNNIVSSKIAQADISFSALLTSISGLTKIPAAPKAAAPAGAAAAAAPPPTPSSTPLADAAAKGLISAQALATQVAVVHSLTQQFGLSGQEKRVEDCIKNLQ